MSIAFITSLFTALITDPEHTGYDPEYIGYDPEHTDMTSVSIVNMDSPTDNAKDATQVLTDWELVDVGDYDKFDSHKIVIEMTEIVELVIELP